MRRCCIVSARTTRQKRVQSMMAMAMITDLRLGLRKATSRIESRTGGKARKVTAFLASLTGTQPRVEFPILPPSVASTPRPQP